MREAVTQPFPDTVEQLEAFNCLGNLVVSQMRNRDRFSLPSGVQLYSQSPCSQAWEAGKQSFQQEPGAPSQRWGVLLFYLTHSSHIKGAEKMTRVLSISSQYWDHPPPLLASAQCNPRLPLLLPLKVQGPLEEPKFQVEPMT